MYKQIIFSTLFTILIFSSSIFAQSVSLTEKNSSRDQLIGWRAEIFLGTASYEGDVLCHSEDKINAFTKAKFAFGLKLKREIIKNLDVSIAYYHTSLAGDDALFTSNKGHQLRNFSFNNQINELTLTVFYEPFRKSGLIVSPYIFGGIGSTFGKSDTDYKLNTKDQPSTVKINSDLSNAKSTSLAIPLGFGITYWASNKLYINADAGLRFGLNDYIDGVSESGNSAVNDYYGIGGISIGYILNGSSKVNIKEY